MTTKQKAYQQTPEWKAYYAKWQREHRDKVKVVRDRYRSTEKGRATKRRYERSEKVLEKARAYQKAYRLAHKKIKSL